MIVEIHHFFCAFAPRLQASAAIVPAVFLRASPATKCNKTRRLRYIYILLIGINFSCLACVVAFQQVRYAAAGLPKCKKDDDRGRKRGQLKVSPLFVVVSYWRITTILWTHETPAPVFDTAAPGSRLLGRCRREDRVLVLPMRSFRSDDCTRGFPGTCRLLPVENWIYSSSTVG